MRIYDARGAVEKISEETAVTLGVFDGVHLGHKNLIRQLAAYNEGLAPVAITLTAHPSFVLGRRESEYWLDDKEEHVRLLFEAGAKYVAVLPFGREVSEMTACELARWMYDELKMRSLLVGYDSRFGSKERDDFGDLTFLSIELGFTLQRGQPFLVNGEPISSSRIRQTLLDGAVENTAAMLGRAYSLSGAVVRGRGVGRELGFPTANISLEDSRKMIPKDGVYAMRMRLLSQPQVGASFPNTGEQTSYLGMGNLGAAPTFDVEKTLLEVHLIDYAGDLYGREVEVEFLHRLRDIRQFDSGEELKRQIQQDRERVIGYGLMTNRGNG